MLRLFCCCLLAAIAAAGCDFGPKAPPRGKLEGKVTLNGKPVAKGKVWFFALDPDGLNVLAEIHDGQYSLPEGEGPSKGKYRVQLSVPSEKINRFPNPDFPGQWIEEPVELLPAKYTTNSTIVVQYDPQSAKTYDFDLTMP